jgi:hypothetical protein
MRVPVGTRVLVKSKSTGCPGEHVFARSPTIHADVYPKSFPFEAWIGKSSIEHQSGHYVISYRDDYQSGDFYLREDFEILGPNPLDDRELDKLFEI